MAMAAFVSLNAYAAAVLFGLHVLTWLGILKARERKEFLWGYSRWPELGLEPDDSPEARRSLRAGGK